MPFMEAAIKCLNALYGRHCRRSFCHQGLWLSPAGIDRPPIPAAARAYEVALASHRTGELSQAPAIGHVLTMIPHVIPFEERYTNIINNFPIQKRVIMFRSKLWIYAICFRMVYATPTYYLLMCMIKFSLEIHDNYKMNAYIESKAINGKKPRY